MAKLPEEFRRAFELSQRESYDLQETTVLQGGRWAAATVSHHDCPDELIYFGSAPGRCVSVGWLAVELGTGRFVFLKPPSARQSPKDVRLGRAGFHDRLCSWRTGSCAVGVRIASKERIEKATPDSVFEGYDPERVLTALYPSDERCFLWEWFPEQGKIQPLDWFAPVSGLVQALEGTPYRVSSWDPRSFKTSGWNGRFVLRNHDSGEDVPLSFPATPTLASEQTDDLQTTSAGFVCSGFDTRQDFGPTEDRHSIVVLDRLGLFQDCPIVRRIDLTDTSRVVWEIGREQIEQRAGGPVGDMLLVAGPKRPCRHLPMIVLMDCEEGPQRRPLWMLDSRTGDLTGPHALPWLFEGTMFPYSFEGQSLRASDDGRLLTFYTDNTFNWKRRRMVVFDTSKKKVVARRYPEGTDAMPVGFDAHGNVIMASGNQILRWRAPFDDDWVVIFSLTQQKDPEETGN